MLTSAVTPVLLNRYIRPNVFGEDGNEDEVQAALQEGIPAALGYLEAELSDNAQTLLEGFTVADAAVAGALGCLTLTGEALDASAFPKSAAYMANLGARASVQVSLTEPAIAA